MTPTEEAYSELQQAYDHFNAELFGGQLPPCLLTFQRKANSCGYFSAARFVRRHDGEITAEIAVNPEYFALVPMIDILQTVAHESVHLWQHYFGSPGRARYHNSEWADKMEAIGLMPSDTGKPGGRRTGQNMSDYPIPGGPFMVAVEKLLTAKFQISWLDRYPPPNVVTGALGGTSALAADAGVSLGVKLTLPEPKPQTRAKFVCPKCKAAAWGKPGLRIICEPCEVRFEISAARAAA